MPNKNNIKIFLFPARTITNYAIVLFENISVTWEAVHERPYISQNVLKKPNSFAQNCKKTRNDIPVRTYNIKNKATFVVFITDL